MRRWFEGGAGGSGEVPGDGGNTPPAVETPEGGSGAGVEPAAPEDAAAAAERARDEYIARVAAETAQRVLQDWSARQPAPAAPAAQPPMAGQRVVAELQAEAAAIQAEDARLRAAFTRDGVTSQNLYDQAELTRREARFAAQVNLVGLQESERRQAVSARSSSDDEARKKAWGSFAAEHPNVDPDLLRDAFEKRWEREHPATTPAKPATPAAAPNGRAAVNVSAPSEVSAREVRARTMTREQANQHRATLRSDGRDREAADFDRDIRNGKVLVKG